MLGLWVERPQREVCLPADGARDLNGCAEPLAQGLWIGVAQGSELLCALVALGVGAEQLQLSEHRLTSLSVHRAEPIGSDGSRSGGVWWVRAKLVEWR